MSHFLNERARVREQLLVLIANSLKFLFEFLFLSWIVFLYFIIDTHPLADDLVNLRLHFPLCVRMVDQFEAAQPGCGYGRVESCTQLCFFLSNKQKM